MLESRVYYTCCPLLNDALQLRLHWTTWISWNGTVVPNHTLQSCPLKHWDHLLNNFLLFSFSLLFLWVVKKLCLYFDIGLLSFKMFCQTKTKKTTIQCLRRSQTKIYFLCLLRIVFFWCWWMCALWPTSALHTAEWNLKIWVANMCETSKMLTGQQKSNVPTHSYCKSEGTFLVFSNFSFYLHLIFCLKCCNQALISPCHSDSFLALSSTSTGKLDSDVTRTFAHTFRRCWFLVKTMNEQMKD